MDQKVSKETKRELLEALKNRYRVSSKKEKGRILDEFTSVSGYHAKACDSTSQDEGFLYGSTGGGTADPSSSRPAGLR